MTDCNNCASLCCIAPSIHKPDEDQGRITGMLIKAINTKCEHLCNGGGCRIYEQRDHSRSACIYFDCKGFGPVLTQYLSDNNGFTDKGTLNEHGLQLYILLNGMLYRTFYGSKDPDLSDAIAHYTNTKKWPEWMLSDEYYDYLFRPRLVSAKNPRFKERTNMTTKENSILSKIRLAFF